MDKTSFIIYLKEKISFSKEFYNEYLKVKKKFRKEINTDETIELKEKLCIIFERDESQNYVLYKNCSVPFSLFLMGKRPKYN